MYFFFFKHKTAYEMRISDWSSDVCSSDLLTARIAARAEDSMRYSTRHRREIAERCRSRGLALASHDDTTEEHVDEALDHGIAIAEFPTTLAAAAQARRHGMTTVMGAPNLVRGGSHSGNVSTLDLAEAGLTADRTGVRSGTSGPVSEDHGGRSQPK